MNVRSRETTSIPKLGVSASESPDWLEKDNALRPTSSIESVQTDSLRIRCLAYHPWCLSRTVLLPLSPDPVQQTSFTKRWYEIVVSSYTDPRSSIHKAWAKVRHPSVNARSSSGATLDDFLN